MLRCSVQGDSQDALERRGVASSAGRNDAPKIGNSQGFVAFLLMKCQCQMYYDVLVHLLTMYFIYVYIYISYIIYPGISMYILDFDTNIDISAGQSRFGSTW